MIVILLWVNKESYFHFWEERISLPVVTQSIKFQSPGHRFAVKAGNLLEHTGECTAIHILPLNDAAVSIGQRTCSASDRSVVVLEESQRYGYIGSRQSTGEIKDMAGDRISLRRLWWR